MGWKLVETQLAARLSAFGQVKWRASFASRQVPGVRQEAASRRAARKVSPRVSPRVVQNAARRAFTQRARSPERS